MFQSIQPETISVLTQRTLSSIYMLQSSFENYNKCVQINSWSSEHVVGVVYGVSTCTIKLGSSQNLPYYQQ